MTKGGGASKPAYVDLLGPEDGVTQTLQRAVKMLATALLRAKLADCLRKMRKITITPTRLGVGI